MPPHPLIRIAGSITLVGLIVLANALAHRYALPGATTGGDARHGFQFEEVAAASGIVFQHEAPVFDAKINNIMPDIASVGAAVAVCDPNGDGRPDLYVTNSGLDTRNALFINNEKGAFSDRAAEAQLADLNQKGMGASMGSIWADLDNDGREDVVIYKYGTTQIFKNTGSGGELRFEDRSARSGASRWMNSNAATFIDYDRDGLLDLYVAGYFRDDIDLWNLTTTRIRQESMDFAKNGGHNYLYKNLGDFKFKDVTAETGADSTRWTLATGSADFNDDGWPDLYLANDFGVEQLLINLRGAKFEDLQGIGLSETSKSGMCVAIGDCSNSGRFDVYITNITKAGFSAQGNNLRINRLAGSSRFSNVAEGEVADCGWAWGAQFADFNHDGWMDLFVTNGYVSASRTEDYWYDMARIGAGTSEIIQDAANWPPMGNKSLSGYERSRVLVNDGAGGFSDVAPVVGVNDLLDGRSVVVADLFGRGALDVIVANQKGPVLVYKNTVDPENDYVQLTLKATKSNRSAVGADVLLEWESAGAARRQRQVVDGGSGFSSQNEKKLHFGLGRNATRVRATVRWPSGHKQTVEIPELRTSVTVNESSQ